MTPLRSWSGLACGVAVLLGTVVPARGTDPEVMQSSGSARGAEQAMPGLKGQSAVDYLKAHGLYESLARAVATARYEVRVESSSEKGAPVYAADNPAQGIAARFDEAGFTARSHSGQGEAWTLSMRPVGVGYGGDTTPLSDGTITARGDRVEIVRQLSGAGLEDRFVEWYVNRPGGVEQGFTLASRPAGTVGAAPLRLVMAWGGDLSPRLLRGGQGIALARGDAKGTLLYDRLEVVDAAGRWLASRFEVEGREVSIVVEDAGARYPVTIDPILTQVAEVTASDGASNDVFGRSVAIDGDTAIVGAPQKTSANGAVYVYERNRGGSDTWVEVKKLTVPASPADYFGDSVAIDGDTAIVGAPGKNSYTGAAYVFARNRGGADNWGQVAELTASDGTSDDCFGDSVAIDGDTAVVGAPTSGSPYWGAAYVYGRNHDPDDPSTPSADHWGEVKKLTVSHGSPPDPDHFGVSVAIDGDTAVVGADYKNAYRGAAYVFARNRGGADNWGQVAELTASDRAPGDYFGYSVAIDGDTAIVGAYRKSSFTGAAYVYERNYDPDDPSTPSADNWGEVRKLTASGGASNDRFGWSVAIDGDTAVVGAWGNSSATGAAYVHARNSGGSDTWGEVRKLTAPDGAPFDWFGHSVAIDGDTALVGAPFASSDKGAAYVFGGTCGAYAQVADPTASDGSSDDYFGGSVAIDGDTAIIGAWGNNFYAGAAYVLERNSGGADTWGEVRKLTASDAAGGDGFGTSVAIDGDTAVVGASSKSLWRGAAYVYQRNSGGADSWGEVAELTASDGASNDYFGISVAIDGDTAIVGADGKDSAVGAAYVYARNSGGSDTWGEIRKLTASDRASGDHLGTSVAIDGGTAVIGAPGNSSNAGAAYVYARNSGGSDTWGEVRKLGASDGGAYNNLGTSVAIDGDTAVVGAPSKSSSRGAAYVYERNYDRDDPSTPSADTWGEVAKLTASDGASGDNFGFSVAIDGGTAVVGAYAKSADTGAAYVYARNSGGADTWGEVRKLMASDGAPLDSFGTSVAIDTGTVVVGAPNKSSFTGVAYVFGCLASCTGTTTTPFSASTQFTDPVELSAAVSPVEDGTVTFWIFETGDVLGSAAVDGSGTATLAVADQMLSSSVGHYPELAAGTYTIVADFTTSDSGCASSGTATLTVSQEDVTVDVSNPDAVEVDSAGGTANPVTVTAYVTEDADGHINSICSTPPQEVPVTITLTPVGPGSVLSSSKTSVSCSGGTYRAWVDFSNVPVNVYEVTATVSGDYYTGTGDSVLAVYDPSLGFATGGGHIVNPNTGDRANFGSTAKYQKKGKAQGQLLYIEHAAGAVHILKSHAIEALSLIDNEAIILTKNAVFDGVGNYTLELVGIDNGQPGTRDELGLKLVDPSGAVVTDFTFDPVELLGGNIQVPHAEKGGGKNK